MSELKLRCNVLTGEFECVGPREFIDEKFKDFQALIIKVKEDARKAPPPPPSPLGFDAFAGAFEKQFTKQNPPAAAPKIPDEYRDVYVLAADSSMVHLKTIPQNDTGEYARIADAVLLLLLGFEKFIGKNEVLAMTVAECLRQSGAGLKRLDRSADILMESNYITAPGNRAGKKYCLTTRGRTKAEEMLSVLVKGLS